MAELAAAGCVALASAGFGRLFLAEPKWSHWRISVDRPVQTVMRSQLGMVSVARWKPTDARPRARGSHAPEPVGENVPVQG